MNNSSADAQTVKMVTVKCKGCGAINTIQQGTVGVCEYCGTSIDAPGDPSKTANIPPKTANVRSNTPINSSEHSNATRHETSNNLPPSAHKPNRSWIYIIIGVLVLVVLCVVHLNNRTNTPPKSADVKASPHQHNDDNKDKFTEHILACQNAITNGDFNEAQLQCDLARDISPNDPKYLAIAEQLRKKLDSKIALDEVLESATTPTPKPSPSPTQNSNEAHNGKKCDTQTISKEKHLPKWNIEIIDSSVIASMLKDAEKNHLPFLKINASDDLNQKLENYINKDPSKLNPDFKNAFTCTLDDYIRTSSNIGIQLVYCSDHENLVVFLNLVSPVDNKARVYQAKIFDRLFEDAPAIVKTEQTEINGERGVYVAVKYIDYSDGTGTEHEETDIVHYLFLGDKLRYLTDWNAFHIEESWGHNDDGTEEYSCDAKATILRLESTGAKQQEHTFSISTSN